MDTVTLSALRFLSGTFISRFTGLLRDISMAFCFGIEPAVAAFLVAFRFSNLLRRLFGEGALLNGFIPHFENYRSKSHALAAQFFRDLFFSLIVFLSLVILCIECGLLSVMHWGNVSESNQEILSLMIIMFPGLLFICLFSLCSGILQSLNKFFLLGVAPVAFNCVWIIAIWYFQQFDTSTAMQGIAWSIVIAYLLQWLVTMPTTLDFLRLHLSWKELLTIRLGSTQIREMLSAITLGVVGVAAVQINGVIDTLFARYASLEGPAYLNYAIHLQQLPLALVGISLASAVLPQLSRTVAEGNEGLFSRLLSNTVKNGFVVLVPCMMGMFTVGAACINLVYGHGDFSNAATAYTTQCFWGYAIGLLPMALSIILAQAYYAQKNYRIPTIGALLSILVNFLLNSLFIFVIGCGANCLALTTSFAAAFNMCFLFFLLPQANKKAIFSDNVFVFKQIILFSFLAAVVTLFCGFFLISDPTISIFMNADPQIVRDISIQSMHFILLSGIFVAVFYFLAWFSNCREVLQFFSALNIRRKVAL